MKITELSTIENRKDSTEPASVALGSFDGIHIGHAGVIRAAKEKGLKTVVATFRQHPGKLIKNRNVRLLMGNARKEQIFEQAGVDELCYIDFKAVMDMPAEAFLKNCIINALNAEYVICGFNYRFGRGGAADAEELGRICVKNHIVGVTAPTVMDGGEPVSSTRIRRLVEQEKVTDAARLLGRPFEIYFEVEHGRRLGRELGFPTINQILPDWFVSPLFGVYAAIADIGGEKLPAVTNVGVKPTVGSSRVLAETYIMGYDGDLYGKMVKVDLMDFIRSETKFESLEALKAQIRADADTARKLLKGYH